MWYYNVKVNSTYTQYATQWAWADITGLGWRQIKGGAADGVTNLFILLSTAKANDRNVHVYIDSSDNTIRTAYLV